MRAQVRSEIIQSKFKKFNEILDNFENNKMVKDYYESLDLDLQESIKSKINTINDYYQKYKNIPTYSTVIYIDAKSADILNLIDQLLSTIGYATVHRIKSKESADLFQSQYRYLTEEEIKSFSNDYSKLNNFKFYTKLAKDHELGYVEYYAEEIDIRYSTANVVHCIYRQNQRISKQDILFLLKGFYVDISVNILEN